MGTNHDNVLMSSLNFPQILRIHTKILVSMITARTFFKNLLYQNWLAYFRIIGRPSIRFFEIMLISQKTWPQGARPVLFIYGCSENFYYLFLRKNEANFQIN